MSHIYIKKIIGSQAEISGRNWWYAFRRFPVVFNDQAIKKFADSLLVTHSKVTKRWDSNYNSEWICRVYLAARMVLGATLMVNSYEFAENKNLRVASSYLEYYAILNSLRAIVFTSPIPKWDEGELITISHKKTINIVCDIISVMDKKVSSDLKDYLYYLKAYRELISYRAPSSGDSAKRDKTIFNLVELCQLLCEIAQAQSELLEASFLKYAKEQYEFLDHYIDQVCHAQIDGHSFWDDEDWYRIGYVARKWPVPTNIMHIMAEGHVEDFFGAWLPKSEEEIEGDDLFNPDANWGIIFDVP